MRSVTFKRSGHRCLKSQSIVPFEESQHKSDSPASPTKYFGSLIPINSLSIDLTSAMREMEPPAVDEHFSIRGYVAEMRTKDPKICSPFSSEGNFENNLLPLHVPSFRWWQCCVSDVASHERSIVEFVVAGRGDVGTSSFQNVAGINFRPGRTDKTECRNPSAERSEVNPIQIRERNRNTPDFSDTLPTEEPQKASSRSHGSLSVFPPRRKPKLRSLADIMVEQPHYENSKPSSNGFHGASTEMEPILGPHLIRKIAFQDDRGRPGPSGSSKILRRVEISDTESDEDRFDLQHGAKTQPIKPKKKKYLDIGKKTRQSQVENFPKMNSECPTELQNEDVSTGISFYKPGRNFSTVREMGPYSQSGQQMEKMDTQWKSTPPEVAVNHNTSRDCNIKGKKTLDLSSWSFSNAERNSSKQSCLRTNREIPDLNETFQQKTAAARGKQQLSSVSEKSSLPLNKNLDISASCSKETTREGNRQLISEQCTFQTTNNNIEQGRSSDDIPMDIVELLAKKKLERDLEISRNRLRYDGVCGSSMRGSTALYADEHSRIVGIPFPNGATMPDVNTGFAQNNQVNFSHINRSQFSLFNSLDLNQQRKPPSSASSPVTNGPRGADLLWSHERQSVPFHVTVPQNHNRSFQADSFGIPSCSQEGRTISDIKGREEKRNVQHQFMFQEGQSGYNRSNPARSLDPYSNDTIPAMQLLSLMHGGIAPGSSFKVGPKSFGGQTFSPCNNHPRHDNRNFVYGSSFSQNGHSKDFLGLHNAASCSGEKNNASSVFAVFGNSQQHQKQRNSGDIHMAGPSNLVVRPVSSDSDLGPCTLNRNPADFSILDAKNEYTISSKDLKLRKRNAAKEKPHVVNLVVGQKTQRAKKDSAVGKKYSRKQ